MSSPPAWSIGHSKRSTYGRSDSVQLPGPGAYDQSANLRRSSAPRWSIGTSTRREESRNDTPGPGSYNSPGKISKRNPTYHIASRTEPTERDSTPTPGPGAYDVSRLLRGTDVKPPAFTIRARSAAGVDRSQSPGPGAYDQSSEIRLIRAPTVRLGTAKRDRFYTTQDIPGPASYDTKSFESKRGPKWGFGTSERNETETSARIVPGPGTYKISSMFEGQKRGPLIISRRPDSALFNGSKIPGPGAYNPSLTIKQRAPSFRIGSAPRNGLEIEHNLYVPGPGNYANVRPSRHGGTVVFGKSKRKPLNEFSITPGPAAYEVNSSTNYGPKFAIIPRRDDVNQSQKDKSTPGPADYKPSFSLVKTNLGKVA